MRVRRRDRGGRGPSVPDPATFGPITPLEKFSAMGENEFTGTVKKILMLAACALGAYLLIPIFIARKTADTCSKTEAEKHMTRPPFPTK